MAAPAEVVQMICTGLSTADLKSMRLVCRKLSHMVAPSLYRSILLKPNVGSFRRMQSIAAHPRFRNYVKTLVYSGIMLQPLGKYSMSEKGYRKANGQGSSAEAYSYAIEEFKESFTDHLFADPHRKYCDGEWRKRTPKILGREYAYLVNSMRSLPRLEEVCYDSGEHCSSPSHDGPIGLNNLTSIGRDVLVEPIPTGGHKCRIEQPTLLLSAAYTAQKNVTSIRASIVPLAAFEQLDHIYIALTEVTRACQIFSLQTSFDPFHRIGESVLSSMLANAPLLHTLELSFGRLSDDYSPGIVGLKGLFDQRKHWPNLKRLQLQGMYAIESLLMEVLTLHASTLRSLRLGDIRLREHERLPSADNYGSWVSIIQFLQSSMGLQHMSFEGTLSNGWDEAWCIRDPDQGKVWNTSMQESAVGLCLKHRVERFVVEGGDFPLVKWGRNPCGAYNNSWVFYNQLIED